MTEPNSFSDAVRRVEESTFRVSSESTNGVAFRLGHDQFVTARHVVDGYSAAMLWNAGSGYNAPARVIGTAGDLALLRVGPASALPLGAPLKALPDQELQPDARVALVGYPLGVVGTPIVTNVVERRTTTDDTWLTVAAEIGPDLSGAPAVDTHGRVVGMVVSKFQQGATSGRVLGEPSLSRLLREAQGSQVARLEVVASHSAIRVMGTTDIVCTVLDERGGPVRDVSVRAIVTAGSIGVSQERMIDERMTDVKGQVVFPYQAPSTPGFATIAVLADELTATADVVISGSPSSLSVIAAHGSVQVLGTTDIVCIVVDEVGSPVPDVPVRASVAEGRGRIEDVERVTDATGRAVFPYKAPSTTGPAFIVVRTGALEAGAEVAVVGPPAQIQHDAPEVIEALTEMVCHYTVLDEEGLRIDDVGATVSLLRGGGALDQGRGWFVYSAPATATRADFEIRAGEIRQTFSVTVR